MCENAYLSIKNPKASRALKQALDPGRRMLASLRWQLSASEAGPPLDQILDPHLLLLEPERPMDNIELSSIRGSYCILKLNFELLLSALLEAREM